MRPSIALLILTILTGCGEGPQTPAEETASRSNEAAAPTAKSPDQVAITPEVQVGEEPSEAPVEEPAAPPDQAVEVHQDVEEAAGADLIEDSSPLAAPLPDQTATDQPESGDDGEPSIDDVDDPVAVAPPARPVQEPPATEIDDKDDDSASAPPAANEDQPAQAEAPADPVASLLDELQQSAADLRTFTADVLYQTEDALLGQKVARKGSIAYQVDAERNHKKFAIRFTQIIESGRMRQRNKYYIFNDRWLVEVDEAEKTFIKREIVPPGSTFDPLKLGEGPFPLPIGQAREEVMARFDVELIELPEAGSLASLRDKIEVHGLRLIPKADAPEAEDYDHIDLFYDKNTLLPAGVEVIEANGNRKTARLENLLRNPEMDEDFSVVEPDPTVWRIDVRPWQDRP